ncbi:MAG: MBL fold metallo-hydrolase [Clostridiales bacterium]|jgi:beta-lactamase superfamily II metal-dependent hydrolase|nr:MBL fold metallo-hydrolase [Clostridiales bacterium]
MNKKLFTLIYICLLLCIFFGCEQPKKDFEIAFLNTGDSDCIIIEVSETVIIIDTAYDYNYDKIKTYLDSLKVGRIDYLILTHFDKDHIGSAAKIIENYQIGEIIAPNYEKISAYITALDSAVRSTKTNYTKISEDKLVELENGRLWISVPKENIYKDENNYSLIVSLKYEKHSFLFMGDALKIRTQEFLADVDLPEWNYSLVKAPHHGDYSKPLRALCEDSQLEYCVITTDSQDNTEKNLIKLNQELEIKPYYTFDGDIIVTLIDGNLSIAQK